MGGSSTPASEPRDDRARVLGGLGFPLAAVELTPMDTSRHAKYKKALEAAMELDLALSRRCGDSSSSSAISSMHSFLTSSIGEEETAFVGYPSGKGKSLHPTLVGQPELGEAFPSQTHADEPVQESTPPQQQNEAEEEEGENDREPEVPLKLSLTAVKPSKKGGKKRKERAAAQRKADMLLVREPGALLWKEREVVATAESVQLYRRSDSTPCMVLPMCEVQAVGPTTRDVGGRAFCFALMSRERTVYLQANTAEGCRQWCDFLSKTLVSAGRRGAQDARLSECTPSPTPEPLPPGAPSSPSSTPQGQGGGLTLPSPEIPRQRHTATPPREPLLPSPTRNPLVFQRGLP